MNNNIFAYILFNYINKLTLKLTYIVRECGNDQIIFNFCKQTFRDHQFANTDTTFKNTYVFFKQNITVFGSGTGYFN